jgi:hypothetical protein
LAWGSFSGIAAFALPLPFGLGSPDLFGSGGGGFFGGQLDDMVVVVTPVTFQSLTPFDVRQVMPSCDTMQFKVIVKGGEVLAA